MCPSSSHSQDDLRKGIVVSTLQPKKGRFREVKWFAKVTHLGGSREGAVQTGLQRLGELFGTVTLWRRHWHPLQYSCLENPMDGGALETAVHGVAKSRTRLSNFIFIFHFHALEKEMATHSSVLAWRIPGTGEPGGLPFMELYRAGHD